MDIHLAAHGGNTISGLAKLYRIALAIAQLDYVIRTGEFNALGCSLNLVFTTFNFSVGWAQTYCNGRIDGPEVSVGHEFVRPDPHFVRRTYLSRNHIHTRISDKARNKQVCRFVKCLTSTPVGPNSVI